MFTSLATQGPNTIYRAIYEIKNVGTVVFYYATSDNSYKAASRMMSRYMLSEWYDFGTITEVGTTNEEFIYWDRDFICPDGTVMKSPRISVG